MPSIDTRAVDKPNPMYLSPDDRLIQEAAAQLPSEFQLRGFPGQLFRVSYQSSYVSRDVPILYLATVINNAWAPIVKGTVREIQREIVQGDPR